MRVLPRRRWPALLRRYPEVKGVCVGGCLCFKNEKESDAKFRAELNAHAHVDDGWLCFTTWRSLRGPMTQRHELAHLLTGDGHTKRWRAKLLELGGTLNAVAAENLCSYKPKPPIYKASR